MADDFDRDVYCMAGLPFDAVTLTRTLGILCDAARARQRCFLSTANLNYLMNAQCDVAFRDSVLSSDLVVVDGMPLIWMARWLKLPLAQRVAGSTLIEALRDQPRDPPCSIYLFGGPEGVAERAAAQINRHARGLRCVGFDSPGFGNVESMSTAGHIEAINASEADFLVVALGAGKGQGWIMHNLHRLSVPVVSHLGAVVNFEANTIRRAPLWMQHSGLEWLWRIREEPALWKRYWRDGSQFLRLLLRDLLPLGLMLRMRDKAPARGDLQLVEQDDGVCRLAVIGVIDDPVGETTRATLRACALRGRDVMLDLTAAQHVGAGLLGLLLVLEKHVRRDARQWRVTGAGRKMQRYLRCSGLQRWVA